jgi:DNA-binding SARP family transcriptional activator/Tfp pilus assembly protein PilF
MTMNKSKSSHSSRIYTFGSLQIHSANHPLLLKGEKARSLMAYLVIHPRILHRREVLADMLWPDAPPDRVRRNLSDLLYRLQKTIEPGWLTIDDDTIALQPNVNLWVDVWEFDNLISRKDDANLQIAVELYTDDLLPEIYDEWILTERELRRSQYLSVLETLSANLEALGKIQQALIYTRRLILTEPLHEPAHQTYLRLLGRLRRFGEALAHYEYLRNLIKSELNSEPMAETRAIIHSLERERDLENVPFMVEETRPFIGRKAERAAALAVVEAMLIGKGSLLTVEGEAGIGKSRLLHEIAAGASWRGAAVFQGQVSETPGASPFSPLDEALAPLINSPRGKQLETMLANETLAVLAPLNPKWSTKAASYDMTPEQEGKRFYNALNLFGETLARLAPVVLILDDLHWANPVLWECLRSIALGFARHGGLLILAYRRPEIEKLPGWETIQTWDRDGLLKTISLEPFNIEEVAQFVGETTNGDPAEIRAWTGGNPFFIKEWLADPNLKRPTNRSAISLRLQTLTQSAKSALESASILGENIPFHLWTEISDFPPLVLAGLSDELMAHHWLRPSTEGFAFAHDLIRSAVYDSIEQMSRRELHERAAHAFSTLDPDNWRALAFHLDQAGLVTEAAKAYRLAGEQDLARFAFHEAQNELDRALALLPFSLKVERIETALALTKACDATGDRVRQKSALDEALARARESDTYQLQALLANGRFATHTGQVAEAEKQLVTALALARRLHDDSRETETITLFSNLAIEQSKWNEAYQWSIQGLEHARATGDQLAEGRALRNIGIVARKMGKPEEAIHWYEKAIFVHRALGNRLQVSISQTNLLSSLYEMGAWDRLIATSIELVPVLDALGDRLGATIARHNQSLAYYALGEYATARQILERAIQESERLMSRRRVGLSRNVLGLVSEAEGNYQEAQHLYRAALEDAEAMKAVMEMGYAQHDLGALLVRLNQPVDAIPHLEAARAVWTEQGNLHLQVKSEGFLGLAYLAAGDRVHAEELAASGWTNFQSGVPVGEQTQDWLWALYRLLTTLMQSDSARDVLSAAYGELQRQAQYISDSTMRRGFFERVQINHDIVNAYDQLNGSPRVISVSLARKDVPLGRTLREDEFVTVQWTLNSPEDEAISDKSIRRHHRLKRLLEEAEKQSSAPTDEDLAGALGVSRRTILRDMQVLKQEIPRPPTRKRK